jgi:hypothetical protein
MIGQYLPNNYEKRYSVILPKISDLNRPLDHDQDQIRQACIRSLSVMLKCI